MARRVQIHLVDDIDGSPADETLRFALDGVPYEIDVTTKHAKRLRSSLEKFVGVARKAGRSHVVVTTRARGAAAVRGDRLQNQAIRDWAKRKGLDVNDRGRVPRILVEQYQAEAGR